MRRPFFLLMFPVFPLVVLAAGAASAAAPEASAKANPVRIWYDPKASVTQVEFLSAATLPLNTADFTQYWSLRAGFRSKGYRTDPPERVTLLFSTDAKSSKKSGITLFTDGRTVGAYKSRTGGEKSATNKWIKLEFEIPRQQYIMWVNGKFPILEFDDGEGSVISGDLLATLRELSRRMIPRRALTFYYGRESLTATTLNDGRVLVAGGYDGIRALKNCEIYDPATGRFATGLKMQFPRRNHTATLLHNGKVLIVGGGIDGSDTALDSAELFDPATNRFSPAGKMRDARMSHTATLLGDGKVLIAGGGGKQSLAGAELFDPDSNSFNPIGNLNHRRLGHTATLLKDGRALIIGGVDGDVLKSTEIFEPKTESFSSADDLEYPRWEHTASLLPDGSVLIAGGYDSLNIKTTPYERYSPEGHRAIIGRAHKGRWGHLAIGNLMLVGGFGVETTAGMGWRETLESEGHDLLGTSKIQLDSNFFETGPSLLTPRRHFAAATLKDGRILLIGGLNLNNPALNTAEFYDPKTDEIVPWRDIVNGEK